MLQDVNCNKRQPSALLAFVTFCLMVSVSGRSAINVLEASLRLRPLQAVISSRDASVCLKDLDTVTYSSIVARLYIS